MIKPFPVLEPVRLVEQHIIKRSDERFERIDQAAFAAKNLYNKANYLVRQAFIQGGKWLKSAVLYHQLKQEPEYQGLPRKVSALVLHQLEKNWKGFFAALKVSKKQPEKFLGRPKLPKYKDKLEGRFLLLYDIQAISKVGLRSGLVQPSQLGISVKTQQTNIDQVRIVPRKGFYVVEVVYTVCPAPNPALDSTLVAGLDIGLSNLATVTSNQRGFQPLVVNGRPLKAMNQFYNKRKAELQSKLTGNRRTSNRINRLSGKRNRKVKHYLHVASRRLIDHLVDEGVGVLVIGRNKGWKQSINIGKANNQSFVQLPFAQFIQMLTYKAKLAGIQVRLQEESYTSKCSFLDHEPIQKQTPYQGQRIKRGLFRTATGRLINADVNGSYNIIKKAIPEAFLVDGIEDIAVHPLRLTPA